LFHPDSLLLPPTQERARIKAVYLERVTLGLLSLDIILLYITMGNSQAMKTAWLDNVFSMVPAIVFLLSEKLRRRRATDRYPYGYPRMASIAFLLASFAIFALGSYLMYEAVMKLVWQERLTVGVFSLFGHQIWAGWPMIAASIWSGLNAAVIARLKLPLGKILHNRVILADATMGKADWMVSISTVLGVLGGGAGLWWADPVAAGMIACNIWWDGLKNLRSIFDELLDHTPATVDNKSEDPIVGQVKAYLDALPWVKEYRLFLHERGLVLAGQVYVVPVNDRNLMRNIAMTIHKVRSMHWRVADFAVTPVFSLLEVGNAPKPE